MSDPSSSPLAFGPFVLDVANARLMRDGVPVTLPPRPFGLLVCLATNHGRLMTKAALLDAVWGHRHVGDAALKVAVNALRSALLDDAATPRWIQTVPRRGYRFVGTVKGIEPAAAAGPGPTQPLNREQRTPEEGEPILIGRSVEIERLLTWAVSAADQPARVAIVHGEAGIGKTCLLDAVAEGARRHGVAVAQGDCLLPAGGSEPYMPVLDALASICRAEDGPRWIALLRRFAPTWLRQLPWLSDESERARLALELSAAPQERMLREFGALLDELGRHTRVMFLLEDLHWSDQATIKLLEYLGRRRGATNWRLIASFRTAERTEAAEAMLVLLKALRMRDQCIELVLEPLRDFDVDAFLERRVDGANRRGRLEFAKALHAHSGGLPLFMAHVVRLLQREGALPAASADIWSVGADALRKLQLPATIHDLIDHRAMSLPEGLQRTLEAASVLGLAFTDGVLAAVLGRSVASVSQDCEALARPRDWLRSIGLSDGGASTVECRYVFRHAWYQRVLYARCKPGVALRLHLAIALELRQRAPAGQPGPSHAAEIATHLECALAIAARSNVRLAEVEPEACSARIEAGRTAEAMHAPADALAHYEAACGWRPDPDRLVALQARMALLHEALGNGRKAWELSRSALANARQLANTVLLQDSLIAHAEVCRRIHETGEALACAEELLCLSDSLPLRTRVRSFIVKADALRDMGNLAQSDAVLASAETIVPAGEEACWALLLDSRSVTQYQRGALVEALSLAVRSKSLYQRSGDDRRAAFVSTRIGAFALMSGQAQRAQSELLEALSRFQAMHDVAGQRSALLNLIKIHTDRGEVAEARHYLDMGWNLSPDFESPVKECTFLQAMYYCAYLAGDLGSALDLAERVLAIGRSLDAVHWRVGTLAIVFDLYMHLGDHQRARQLLDSGAREFKLNADTHLARRLQIFEAWLGVVQGRAEQALTCLEAIRSGPGELLPEDAAVLDRVCGEALLALGQARAAIERLARYDAAPTIESWALILAARMIARCEADADESAIDRDIESARQVLAANQLPPLERLHLSGALASLLDRSGRSAESSAVIEVALRVRDHVAASLGTATERRALLARRFAFPRVVKA